MTRCLKGRNGARGHRFPFIDQSQPPRWDDPDGEVDYLPPLQWKPRAKIDFPKFEGTILVDGFLRMRNIFVTLRWRMIQRLRLLQCTWKATPLISMRGSQASVNFCDGRTSCDFSRSFMVCWSSKILTKCYVLSNNLAQWWNTGWTLLDVWLGWPTGHKMPSVHLWLTWKMSWSLRCAYISHTLSSNLLVAQIIEAFHISWSNEYLLTCNNTFF